MNNLTIEQYNERHENKLNEILTNAQIPADKIKTAIHYSLFSGGKRIRPLLVYLCGELVNAKLEDLDIISAAIELTHCYSLIHDDLPAMDNDDYRRGKLSCHRAFDEATAILVGDGLQAFSVEILLHYLSNSLSADKIIAITYELVKACGPSGMVSGQSLDLSELTHKNISLEELTIIHQLKTGKLMQACIKMAIHAGNPTDKEVHALETFAEHLGLVFQMQDDYLDMYDNISHVGKGRSSDAINQKTTFATIYSEQELLNKISYHFATATKQLQHFQAQAKKLIDFISHIQKRTPNIFLQSTENIN